MASAIEQLLDWAPLGHVRPAAARPDRFFLVVPKEEGKGDRWPTRWPRMKLRGARRKRLAGERKATTRVHLPIMRPTVAPDGAVTYTAASESQPGDVAMIFEAGFVDGFGRPNKSRARPAKKRNRHGNQNAARQWTTRLADLGRGGDAGRWKEQAFSVSFGIDSLEPDLLALLRGDRPRRVDAGTGR